MSKIKAFLATESNRAYVYRVLVALSAVIVAAGFATADEVQVYFNLVASFLGLAGTGLAVKNTSTSS